MFCDIWSMLRPTWLPKSTNNRSKIHPKMHSIFASIVDRCLVEISSQFRPPESWNMLFFLTKKQDWKNRLSMLTSIFDPILVPIWFHFPPPNPPKFYQNPIFKGIKKFIDFGTDFAANLAPTWGHLGAQVEPSWPIKSLRSRPKRLPRRAWEPEETPRSPPKLRFLSIFDGFWLRCLLIFDGF